MPDEMKIIETVDTDEQRSLRTGAELIIGALGRQYGGDPIESIIRRALEYKREREKK